MLLRVIWPEKRLVFFILLFAKNYQQHDLEQASNLRGEKIETFNKPPLLSLNLFYSILLRP